MNSHIRVKRTLIRAYVGFRFHCSPNPIYLGNSIEYADCNGAGGRSWQARYDLDLGAFG
ncbi:OprD family outer membrane porin, partial [Mycobacterium tuberculosis]|nr:OprD family outer membrane porin [Mycobacterium tuberculosis]